MAGASVGINARGNGISDPVRNFRFLVAFFPMAGTSEAERSPWRARATFGFSSVDGLGVAVDTMPIREGGYNATVHNVPLHITYNPVTLQRGLAIGSSQNWEWMRWMYKAVQGSSSGVSGMFRSDVEIAVLNSPMAFGSGGNLVGGTSYEGLAATDDMVACRFMLYGAMPSALIFSSLNAMDNALIVESISLVHEGLDMQWSTTDTSTGAWFSAPNFLA